MAISFQTTKKSARPRRSRTRAFSRILAAGVAALLLGGLAVAVAGVGLYFVVALEHQEETAGRPELVENSRIYDARGREIWQLTASEDRRTVGAGQLGEHLPRAVVAVEDRRFYEHGGVDYEGVLRAAWTDLKAMRVEQGGSTITEQLMKNLFVDAEQRAEVSFWRRFEQAALAFDYERSRTKEEILTAYLNTVYFGNGAYGAEVAAERYFGKSASDLTLAEAASLAGFLDAPSTYVQPGETEGSGRAVGSRNTVLGLMEEQGMISAAERREAAAEPMEFSSRPLSNSPANEPFAEGVRREVEALLGPEALRRGGLEIHTTLDPALQEAADEAASGALPLPDDPSAAVVSVEPQSGAVRALAGQKGDFNLALDTRRQPGSSFKPVVLATALREYVSPDTSYVSKDLTVEFAGLDYEVGNYDDVERGRISVEEAMAESDNTVFVQLAADLGLENVVRTAGELGITTEVEPYPSTAIGGLGTGVSPLDMASVYATFAGGGVYREPYFVERVEKVGFGEGERVYGHRAAGSRVLTSNQADLANQVLREVVEEGTASEYHDLDEEIGKPSAGKTGTTDEFVDAWYVGYTPRLSTAVWVGYPDGSRPMVDVHGLDVVNGENFPLDIWSSYMSRATAGDPPLDFRAPDEGEFSPLDRGYAREEPDGPLDAFAPLQGG